MTNAITTKQEPKFIEYVPFGAIDKIKLNIEIVKRFICIPTKSGKVCDESQATRFMMLSQTQRLNPFAGDCFLAGYDGKNGPVFSMITAHVAFMKRAESCADYEGMESGVILVDSEGKITEREGDFVTGEENCVGGWARVHRKGRKPIYRRLSIASMRPNYDTPFWSDVKAPGQIVKCAEADALRATFPTLLGGLYNPGESSSATIEVSATVAQEPGNGKIAEASSAPALVQDVKPSNAQDDLAKLVTDAGFSFDDFRKWGEESGNLPEGDSLSGFADVKTDIAKRLLRAPTGLTKGLAALKGAA